MSLWPTYRHPSDLAAIEAVPLADRGLPPSTYALLVRAAERWPDAPATSFLVDAARHATPVRRTFAGLLAEVHAIGNALAKLGVHRRAAVALLSPNTAALPAAVLAAQAVGVAAPLNPALAAGALALLVARFAPRVLVAAGPELAPDVWEKAREVARTAGIATLLALRPTDAEDGTAPPLAPLEGVEIAYLADLAAAAPRDRLAVAPPAASDLAAYFATGGTTGAPKLAAHTHGNEVADAWMVAAPDFQEEGATLFGALPLFHVNALVVTTLAPLFKGQHVVWAGPLGYREPLLYGLFWKIVEHHRITAVSAVPTVYGLLAQVPIDADIASLRHPVVGAAPLPPAVRAAFRAHTGRALLEGYGLTEATCASARSFPDHERPSSVGQRLPYQEICAMRVDAATGARTPLPAGEVGVLHVRGPVVFPGYLVAGPGGPVPDPAGRIFDGWLDTGDLGSVDADGFVALRGRAKDLIIRGGHNIDPQVVEDALLAHPAVVAASAVGSPDPHAGEVPVAYVVTSAAVSAEELVAFAAARVPEKAAAPRSVHVVPALPLTDIGKPYKPELRRDATERALAAALPPGAVVVKLVDGAVVVELRADLSPAEKADAIAILERYPVRR